LFLYTWVAFMAWHFAHCNVLTNGLYIRQRKPACHLLIHTVPQLFIWEVRLFTLALHVPQEDKEMKYRQLSAGISLQCM